MYTSQTYHEDVLEREDSESRERRACGIFDKESFDVSDVKFLAAIRARHKS